MDEKPLVWLGTSLRDLRAFPELARRRAGFELSLIQQGLQPSDWKPMPDAGSGVVEIRIHTGSEHRVFYLACLEEAVYVLHAFEKKTQKTPRRDLELASARLAELMRQRQAKRKGDKA